MNVKSFVIKGYLRCSLINQARDADCQDLVLASRDSSLTSFAVWVGVAAIRSLPNPPIPLSSQSVCSFTTPRPWPCQYSKPPSGPPASDPQPAWLPPEASAPQLTPSSGRKSPSRTSHVSLHPHLSGLANSSQTTTPPSSPPSLAKSWNSTTANTTKPTSPRTTRSPPKSPPPKPPTTSPLDSLSNP